MGRRGMLAGAWALSTAAATLVAWGAVHQVTDQVSPPAALPLPAEVAQRQGQPTPGAARPTAEPTADLADRRRRPAPEPTQPSEPAGTTGDVAGREAQPPEGRRAPQATQPPAPARETADGPDADGRGEQQQPAAAARTEAYDVVGGVVTVRYRDGATTLVEATPNTGFDVDVHDGGPQEVEVRFRSDGHESRFRTRWHEGAPQPEREERPR